MEDVKAPGVPEFLNFLDINAIVNGENGRIEEWKAVLDESIPPEDIAERKGPKNTRLKYVKGTYVIRKMNEVFGPDNWTFVPWGAPTLTVLEDGKAYYCMGTLFVRGMLPKSDIGWSDVRGVPDRTAATGAVTDCLKRCARHYGEVLGLDLYDNQEYGTDNNRGGGGKRGGRSRGSSNNNQGGGTGRPKPPRPWNAQYLAGYARSKRGETQAELDNPSGRPPDSVVDLINEAVTAIFLSLDMDDGAKWSSNDALEAVCRGMWDHGFGELTHVEAVITMRWLLGGDEPQRDSSGQIMVGEHADVEAIRVFNTMTGAELPDK